MTEKPSGHKYNRGRQPGGRGDSARSSFEETTFGQNAGTGPNRRREAGKGTRPPGKGKE